MNNQSVITKSLLDEFGITLGDQDITALLVHLNETLEERIGAEITESLDDEKLAELVDLQENASDEEISAWLTANIPELQQITQDEIDILLGELAENSDSINQTT